MSSVISPGLGLHFKESLYTFRLDQYRVTETRSRVHDTNVVAYTLTVGDQSFTQTLGPTDVDNGNQDVCLEFPGVRIPEATTPVTVAFAIVNSGHDSAAVESALQKGVDVLISKEVGSGSFLGAAALVALDAGLAALFADCDGTVAAASLTVERSAFDALIPVDGRLESPTSHYAGTDSSVGCGANSSYDVTQSVIRVPVQEANSPDTSKLFTIAGRSSGLVLDVPGAVSTAGAPVQQFADNATVAQHWSRVSLPDGSFMISTAINGLVLEAAGSSVADGAVIQLAERTESAAQLWTFEPVDVPAPALPFPVLANANRYFRIRSVSSGKVFDVPARSADPGVKLQQWSAGSGSNNQLWQLLGVADLPPVFTTGKLPIPVILEKHGESHSLSPGPGLEP